MGNLTSKQISALANDFLAMAQSIGDYRYDNYETLSKSQNEKIRILHSEVLNHADKLFSLSAGIVMNDVNDSLESISGVTAEIKESYKKLQNIQRAIDIGESIATLGASIFSKNPQAIYNAIGELITVWKS